MPHQHTHHHDHCHEHHQSVTNIKIAFGLNIFFTIIEIIGGFYTNSLAILSNALHDLGDSLSLGFAWYFQKISSKTRDSKYTYGYRRFALLSAIINSLVLLAGSIIILSQTIPRIFKPEAVNYKGMVIFAVLGILVNGAAALRLRKSDKLNEKVVSLHLLEDVLGWTAVLVGSIVLSFFDFPVIDPILSCLITCYVLYNVYFNLKNGINIFLQSVPSNMNVNNIQAVIKELNGITDIHDFHIWSLDGEYSVVTLHIVVNKDIDSLLKISQIKQDTRNLLTKLDIEHATIEIETENEKCELINC